MKPSLLCMLFIFISLNSFAQKRTLTGTIYDEDKNVLADANVIVKNSTNGTVTNSYGRFAIEVAPKDVLEISYLGFETKEITIDDQKELKVELTEAWEKIDAVEIIAYGGVTCTKRIICGGYLWNSEENTEEKETTEFKRIQGEERLNSLFPNPSTNGLFQLQLNESYAKLTLAVYNMNGQLLQSTTYTKLSKNPQIDLSKQAKGMYLVRIIADGTVLETKKAMRL